MPVLFEDGEEAGMNKKHDSPISGYCEGAENSWNHIMLKNKCMMCGLRRFEIKDKNRRERKQK